MKNNSKETVNQRIKIILDFLKISQYRLSKIIDISDKVMSNIINGKSAPGLNAIEGILINYPNINARWLILGEGEMFVEEAKPTPIEYKNTLNSDIEASEPQFEYNVSEARFIQQSVITITEMSKQLEAYETIVSSLSTEKKKLQNEVKKLKEELKNK